MTGKELDKIIIKCRRENNKQSALDAQKVYYREYKEVKDTIYNFLWKHIRNTKMFREYKETNDDWKDNPVEVYLGYLSVNLKLWDLLAKIKYDEFVDSIKTDKSICLRYYKNLFPTERIVIEII